MLSCYASVTVCFRGLLLCTLSGLCACSRGFRPQVSGLFPFFFSSNLPIFLSPPPPILFCLLFALLLCCFFFSLAPCPFLYFFLRFFLVTEGEMHAEAIKSHLLKSTTQPNFAAATATATEPKISVFLPFIHILQRRSESNDSNDSERQEAKKMAAKFLAIMTEGRGVLVCMFFLFLSCAFPVYKVLGSCKKTNSFQFFIFLFYLTYCHIFLFFSSSQ